MCPACQAEYDDPLNRRFHAQPNACWVCGPQCSGWSIGTEMPFNRRDPVTDASIALSGEIMAIKGIGGFHLEVDATNEAAVLRLRERKHRYGKPLAVMVRDLDAARDLCELTDGRRALLITPARPIVLARAHQRWNRSVCRARNSLAGYLSALCALAASPLRGSGVCGRW